ncbi:MAG: COP23 domain-containing protein [Nostoc sp.]
MIKHSLLTKPIAGCALAQPGQRRRSVTTAGIALTISSSMIQPSLAQADLSFFCDTYQGNYVTKVLTSKGNRAIVSYESWASASGWTAKKRCQQVSSRFQSFYNQNILQYIRSGRVGNYPVICVTPQKGASCQENHVLITLEIGTNPQAALRSLVGQSRGDSSEGVSRVSYQNSPQPSYFSTDNQGNLYVNIEKLIETAPVVENESITK